MEDTSKKLVPHISIKIDDKDIKYGAICILRDIRPDWHPNNIEFKLLTDGITNKLVGCKNRGEDVAETVLVRVYGNKTDLLIDRKAETRNILLLGKVGLAPKLFATFDNGLAYQFVPGCTLTDQSVIQPQIYKLIAKTMAKLHKVQVPEQPNPQPFLWEKIQKFLKLVPDEFSDTSKQKKYEEIVTPKTKIEIEVNRLKDVLTELGSPVVFCHNDLLLGNVIYTKEKECVTFIDYEYAAFNYQAFDIGNHFAEFVGLDNINYAKYPSSDIQMDWLTTYLSEYKDGCFTEEDVQTLYVQVNKFSLISHVFWGLWALIQAEHSYIDFDFLGYAATRFNEYFTRRDQFLALKLPR